MKLALFTVAYGGLWYAGRALTLKEQILKAKELGFQGLSIECKRPVAFPLDLDKKTRKEIKEFADSQGIELVACESMSNFASEVMEHRENNLAMMHDILELAVDLEVDKVKVFAGWVGVMNDVGEVAEYMPMVVPSEPRNLEEVKRWNRAREGIKEVCKWAKDMGITIALQNHAPVLRWGYEDALQMVKEVNMENLKLCLDVPLFTRRQSDAYIHEAVEKCRDLIVMSHYGAWEFEEINGEIVQVPDVIESMTGGIPINYKAYVKELKRINYQGYLIQELCAPITKNHKYAGFEENDRKNKIAAKYMKKLIAEA
ncbi:MAG: sugar phosphate isomerase/epimerase family protein [Candidatus Bathyarchaeia archaeon]